jgi:F5/8 type C domain
MFKQIFTLSLLVPFMLSSQTHAQPINLSLAPKTSVIANGADLPTYPASLAIDGNLDTFWRGTAHGSPTAPWWIIVDLSNEFQVDRIELWTHDTPYVNYFIDYNLYGSINGSTFNLLSTGTLIDPPPPPIPGYYDYFHDTVFLPYNQNIIRYAKFEVIGGSHDAHLNEIEIWGESISSVPEPNGILLLFCGVVGLICYETHRDKGNKKNYIA